MTQKRLRSLASKLTRATGLQLILVAGSLSVLSYFVGRDSGIHQSEAQRANLTAVQVSERLSKKLSYPTIINGLNEAAITSEPELLHNFDKLSQRFWRQLKSFPVDYINYGATDGTFLGIEKSQDNLYYHNEDSARFGRGKMLIFSMGDDGKRDQHISVIPDMTTSHEEAWYVDTVKAGKPTWSRIYAWEDQPNTFSISYNAPVYDQNKRLIGVVGVDMIINKLSSWLKNAWTNNTGLALIVERNGDLVASSQPELTFIRTASETRRRNLRELPSPLASKLREKFQPDAEKIQPGPTSLVQINGKPFLIKATPWGDQEGLDWMLLTGIAATQEVSTLQSGLLITLLISLSALGITLLINQRLIRGLLTPLTALKQASKDTETQIASMSDEPQPLSFQCDLELDSTREIQDLNQAIQAMVMAFNQLTSQLREKETQIIDLFAQQRAKDEIALAQMSNKLRVSLEAASIAHEINQPISILRLTSEYLLQSLPPQPISDHTDQLTSQLTLINNQTQRIAEISEKIRSLLRNTNSEHKSVDLKQVIMSSVHYISSNNPDVASWLNIESLDALPDGTAFIQGDATQLQIALINLIRNAIEAIESQTDPQADPSINIHLHRANKTWQIDVLDNGPGIAEKRLIEQSLTSTKPEGSGLGLFLVRSAIDNHGGELQLRNASSGGLLAQLIFPIDPLS
ncbi:histidine kinase [Synechococcus sp. BS56D]|uniref:ATP-binding protein n=1 Tax=Synechococcus sp. BS56D TaxID=2055944 RepID=UPI00103D4F6C|nr:ATP-binding protein [Synechococcus sp. BS56D]TCD56624.1 histidine kinase [Synechococcus sp. BS56D]